MKSAIICYNCEKLTRYSETYAMKVLIFSQEFVQELDKPETKKYAGSAERVIKVRVCRKCARAAGYKIKVAKKKPLKV